MKRPILFVALFCCIDVLGLLGSYLNFDSFEDAWRVQPIQFTRLMADIGISGLGYLGLRLGSRWRSKPRLAAIVPATVTGLFIGWLWFGPLVIAGYWNYILISMFSFVAASYIVLSLFMRQTVNSREDISD